MNPFSYERASDIASACASAARPAAKFIAGGTNLVDLMKLQIEAPGQLVDITRLPLDRIEETAEGGLRTARKLVAVGLNGARYGAASATMTKAATTAAAISAGGRRTSRFTT